MKEWKIYKLGELMDIKGGKRLPKGEMLTTTKNSHPYIRIRDLGATKTLELTSSFEYVDDEVQKHISRYIVNNNDVILSIVGTIGLVAIVGNSLNNANLTENCVKFVNLKRIDSNYLYYFLISPLGQDEISKGIVGAVQPKLPIKNIENISIPVPDIVIQQKIASILTSIDAKIEVNRQINDNLEQQAQALYKSWFIDFEPFNDGEFVNSDLGLIPKGWHVGTYEQIINTTISGDWGKDVITGNYTHKVACVRGCDFQDISIGIRGKTPERYILEKNYQAKRLVDNDVVVEISGGTSTISTGRVCLINSDLLGKYNNDIVCTNFCKVVRPIQSYGAYLCYSWKYKYDCRVMFGYENGTSGIKNFQISDFLSKEPVIIPSESSIKEFQTIIDTLQNNIQTNGSEIMKLESLRDTLLPKLMSGELKINEIDC